MKITNVTELAIPDIKIITFERFRDDRGYFTEPYRKTDLLDGVSFMRGVKFVQSNESYSVPNVIRGLHFQWNPYMGKLVRTISGRMVDLVLDIRKGSPTFGKALAYPIESRPEDQSSQWIWVPPGFAHGNYFTEATTIEYFCSGEYSPGCEAGISPLSDDIDWSLCNNTYRTEFVDLLARDALISEKDKNGLSLQQWQQDERSNQFIYEELL